MIGCGKTVVNLEAQCWKLTVYSLNGVETGCFLLVYSIYSEVYAGVVLASGPKGRGFKSRHLDC